MDTGPLVAYLDVNDPGHSEVVARLDPFEGQLATTSAVITETMHFVSRSRNGPHLLDDRIEGTQGQGE